MSAERLGEWGQKMVILAAVQYCISAGIMNGSKKSKNVVTQYMDGSYMHVLCNVFYENIYHIFVNIVTVLNNEWAK